MIDQTQFSIKFNQAIDGHFSKLYFDYRHFDSLGQIIVLDDTIIEQSDSTKHILGSIFIDGTCHVSEEYTLESDFLIRDYLKPLAKIAKECTKD
jgi:hypothetical protein